MQHVADVEFDTRRRPSVAGRALAGEIDQRRREIDRDHVGAAPCGSRRPERRCRSRHRGYAGPRDRPAATTSSVLAHLVAAGAHRLADAPERRVRGELRPGLDRGAVEVGFELTAPFEI